MAVVSQGRRSLAAALCVAFASSVCADDYPQGMVVAGHEAWMLMPGDTVSVAGIASGRAITVSRGGTLDAVGTTIVNPTSGGPGGYAFGILASDGATASLQDTRIVAEGDVAVGAYAQAGATLRLTNVALQIVGVGSTGLWTRAGGHVVGDGVVLDHTGRDGDRRTARARGVVVGDGGRMGLARSALATHLPGVDAVTVAGDGSTFTAHDTRIVAAGERASAIVVSGGSVAIHGGVVHGRGHAVREGTLNASPSLVSFDRGASIEGRIETVSQPLTVTVTHSSLVGDIVGGGRGSLDAHFRESLWEGRAERLSNVTIDGGRWRMSGDSAVHRLTLRSDARVGFASDVAAGTLRTGALDAANDGGTMILRTRLDGGGPLARQMTDRLLVRGDVMGSMILAVVNAGGAGRDTSPLTDAPRAGDGISVVQVAGAAAATSFHLAGDYVAVGPWQYGLVAWGPGQADASQRLVEGRGNDHWDFRLQSRHANAEDASRAGDGAIDTRPRRALLVPQVPTYLVLANALFSDGMDAMQALWPVHGRDMESAPAWRVRAYGGHAIYRSSLPWQEHAVDYARTARGLQVASDLMTWTAGAYAMRAGFALSTGSGRIVPRAVDGISSAKTGSLGVAVTYAASTDGGAHLHASYGIRQHRIAVDTPRRGEVLTRLRGNADEAAVHAGFRWSAAGRLAVEPVASLLWQRLRTIRGADRDALAVHMASRQRVTWRGGARASIALERYGRRLVAWTPYVDAGYVATPGANGAVDIAGVRFRTGRAGHAAELATGVTLRFRAGVRAYADVTSRTRVGRAGESGRQARAGIVYAFPP